MKSFRWSMIVSLGLLPALGCGGPNDVGGGTNNDGSGPDPWWDTTGYGSGPDTVSASSPASTTNSTSPATTTGMTTTPGDSSAGDSEGEVEGEPDEVGIFGWSIVEPGVSFMGMEGEFIAFIGGEELCIITWTFESGVPNDTCAECDFAYDIVRTEPVVEEDIACADYIDPTTIPTMISMGFASDERLMMFDGMEWVEAGFGEFLPEKGNEFAWFIPYDE